MDSEAMIDTQILSLAFKGAGASEGPASRKIASVTAKEFLLAQTRESQKPLYYVVHPATWAHFAKHGISNPPEHFGRARWAQGGGHRTDQIVIDFGGDFPPYREYSDEAVALAINGGELKLYKLSVSHLPKETRRFLLERFYYLVEGDYQCYPITSQIMEVGLGLFSEFMARYNRKDHYGNTVNDILIFATALQNRLPLRTQDVLLGRFAAESLEMPIHDRGEELLIDFSQQRIKERKVGRESKGYVNRGWSYSIRKRRAIGGI